MDDDYIDIPVTDEDSNSSERVAVEIGYRCEACHCVRGRSDVEIVSDPDDEYGKYPLCVDSLDCTIECVARRREGSSRFKIDRPLE